MNFKLLGNAVLLALVGIVLTSDATWTSEEQPPPEVPQPVEVRSATPSVGQTPVECELADQYADPEFWTEDLDSAAKAVEGEPHKVLLVLFASPLCPPCNQLKKESFNDDTIKAWWKSHSIPVLIDPGKNQELRRKFGVNSVPRLFVYRPNTRKYQTGPKNRKELTSWFREHHQHVMREERQ